jgi:hypothetical protein
MDPPTLWYWLVPLLIALGGLTYLFWRVGRAGSPQAHLQAARESFRQDRLKLEAQFLQTAAASGKPRGLRWKGCQWSELIEWVRDKQTGQLMALVGVAISFEAIEGSDMEGLAAVGNLRNASAVFFFQDGHWRTAGRVIFNLNPDEAIAHFQGGYERVRDE